MGVGYGAEMIRLVKIGSGGRIRCKIRRNLDIGCTYFDTLRVVIKCKKKNYLYFFVLL